ncbi:MAG: type II toxin-antitoxin system RelE/ParE family toxin [Legionellales bacterium]|nr:type II toxin-antitoxin system RelE/ParE family toxin [Legionellales bacterium]
MIKSWKHKGLKQFYETSSKSGINPDHAKRLTMIIQLLDAAEEPEMMNLPGLSFHKLQGQLADFYSVKVNGNWRVIFKFEGKDAILVDYVDYH